MFLFSNQKWFLALMINTRFMPIRQSMLPRKRARVARGAGEGEAFTKLSRHLIILQRLSHVVEW